MFTSAISVTVELEDSNTSFCIVHCDDPHYKHNVQKPTSNFELLPIFRKTFANSTGECAYWHQDFALITKDPSHSTGNRTRFIYNHNLKGTCWNHMRFWLHCIPTAYFHCIILQISLVVVLVKGSSFWFCLSDLISFCISAFLL